MSSWLKAIGIAAATWLVLILGTIGWVLMPEITGILLLFLATVFLAYGLFT